MNVPWPRRRDDGSRVRAPDDGCAAEGLASAVYLSWRCEEECYRAQRYGRPLTLVVVELPQDSDSSPVERRFQNWLPSHLRMSDIAGHLGDGCYAILLPETDQRGASGLETRLRLEFPRVKTGVAVHPRDGRNLELLVQAARRTSGQGT